MYAVWHIGFITWVCTSFKWKMKNHAAIWVSVVPTVPAEGVSAGKMSFVELMVLEENTTRFYCSNIAAGC